VEASLIAIIVGLGALALGASFAIGAIWAKRAALRKHKRLAAEGELARKGVSAATAFQGMTVGERGAPSPPAAPLTYDDKMEIPAALVGAHCKEAIERFAPVLGLSPVKLLRAALAQGLTGGRPITAEVLDAVEELKLTELPPPSKPGPSRPS
jgi:hypothetical protein